MGRGINFYDDKRKRAMRRRNHIARDLKSPDGKYRQRIKESKISEQSSRRKEKYPIRWDDDTE